VSVRNGSTHFEANVVTTRVQARQRPAIEGRIIIERPAPEDNQNTILAETRILLG